ncbi:hypothetical protein ABIA03_004375 [Bradyrhizobium yuanmingense]|uniref:Uncharacterized protein n=1 Tax=Bradyrhizobium yuanmingense TaxID=108015 RepID=A0ABV4GEH3_9BRAD|nr:hypothetical protein [Bradyrhizobium yuanmingense]
MDTPPIEALRAAPTIPRRQTHHTILDLRPAEDAVPEPLGEQAQTTNPFRPEYQLDPVRPLDTKHINSIRERIGLHVLAYKHSKPLHPLRKSTSLVATINRTVPNGPITGLPSAHGRWRNHRQVGASANPDRDAFGFDLDASAMAMASPDIRLGFALRCLAFVARNRDRQPSAAAIGVLASAR